MMSSLRTKHLPTGWLTIRWYLQYLGSFTRFISSGRLYSGNSITFFSSKSFNIASMSESGKGYVFCSNSLKVLLYLSWVRGGSPIFISFALFFEEILIGAEEVLMGAVLTVNASLRGFFPVLSTFRENTLSFLKSVIGSFFPVIGNT
ncbi:hypothetical protein ACFX1T_002480 [Malus domestica]